MLSILKTRNRHKKIERWACKIKMQYADFAQKPVDVNYFKCKDPMFLSPQDYDHARYSAIIKKVGKAPVYAGAFIL